METLTIKQPCNGETKNGSILEKYPKTEKMAENYRKKYSEMFNLLPKWKQNAVVDSIKLKNKNDYLVNDFIREVIAAAEKEQ